MGVSGVNNQPKVDSNQNNTDGGLAKYNSKARLNDIRSLISTGEFKVSIRLPVAPSKSSKA